MRTTETKGEKRGITESRGRGTLCIDPSTRREVEAVRRFRARTFDLVIAMAIDGETDRQRFRLVRDRDQQNPKKVQTESSLLYGIWME